MHYKFKAFILVAALLYSVTQVFAQKTGNPEKAKVLKAMQANKKAKIVSSHYQSAYSFEPSSDKIYVVSNEVMDLISLEGNLDYARPVFYNENLILGDTEIEYTSGKNIPFANSCGNYEVDDVFYSDAKVCNYKFKFLYEGTEISFTSKTKYTDPKYLTKVFFHDDLPVQKREIAFTIPKTVSVDLIERNFEGYDITKSVSETGSVKTYKYSINNLKAMQPETNSLGFLYYYPHILVITKEYMTNSGKQKGIASVADLYKWYSTLVKDVKNDSKSFDEEVKRLTAAAKTQEEKIKAIYYWVQDNIKYIAFEDGIAGFKPEAAQNVYNNRYGDCKGMANLTKAMLKSAGFDARLTWIGTNRIPYTYEVPTLAVDNHMICTLSMPGQFYILDPTEKFIALGKNAERIQGKEMLIEDGESYIIRKVPVSDYNANLFSRTETVTLDGKTLKGEGEVNFNGESKTQILNLSSYAKIEDKKKFFYALSVPNFSNTDVVELQQLPELDREKPLDIKYTFSLNNKVSNFGDDVYVDLDWNKSFSDLKMEDDRETDYYFHRKLKQKTNKKFKVPAGYKVTHVPDSFEKIHKDFAFKVTFKQVGNEVVYSNEITVTDGIVRKGTFADWNGMIAQLKEIYNDSIVLTKQK
jgi:transglutaminase-like putative cysteine protease